MNRIAPIVKPYDDALGQAAAGTDQRDDGVAFRHLAKTSDLKLAQP